MKRPLILTFAYAALVGALGAQPTTPAQDPHHWLGTETVKSRVGNFEFTGGYPTEKTNEQISELLVLNRAVEVYLQNVSAVSMYKFRQGLSDFGAKSSSQIAIWPELLDAKTLLLTANSDTVYTIAFLDLQRDGPTVVELPPHMLGLFNDMWMRYIADGGVAGPDKGKAANSCCCPPTTRARHRPAAITSSSRPPTVCGCSCARWTRIRRPPPRAPAR